MIFVSEMQFNAVLGQHKLSFFTFMVVVFFINIFNKLVFFRLKSITEDLVNTDILQNYFENIFIVAA